jgi:PAS domain S-box-containing protein
MEVLLIIDGTTILGVNESAFRMAGVARERLVGHRLTEFARTGDEASLARTIQGAVESGRSSGEIPLVMSNGRDAIVEFASSRFSPGRYVLEIRDVTERTRAQAALVASEASLRVVFEHAADGVFVIDDDGVLLDASRTTCHAAVLSSG